MISLRNTYILASTKLRTRRVRLIVTLIVSGLLFTVLIAGSFVIRGALASLSSFTADRYTNRFILNVSPGYDPTDYIGDPAFVKRALELDKVVIAKKTAEAKRLDIPYDPASEPRATEEGGPQGPKQVVLNLNNASAQQAYAELVPKAAFADELTRVAGPYGLKHIYQGKPLAPGQTSAEMAPIIAGKEVEASKSFSYPPDPFQNFIQSTQALDNELIKPLALTNANLNYTPGDAVPILAPVDAVEKLAGLTPLSTKATDQVKLQRLKDVRAKAAAMTFTVCYRNAEAVELRNLAKSQATEIAQNAGNADYVAPELQYAESTTPCSPIIIKQDKRTPEAKLAADHLQQFKLEFGTEQPQTIPVTFRVVGVLPKIDYGSSAADLSGLISSLTTSSTGPGWVISTDAAAAHPILKKLYLAASDGSLQQNSYFAEFNNREGQKKFLDEHSCQGDPNSSDCKQHQKYLDMPYGNPLATLYDAKKDFDNSLRIVLLIIAGITAVIMMGTIGKIIADSRKETSVFRAVGATRLDIAQVYVLYAAILSALAFLVAAAIGTAIALYLDIHYGPTLSLSAVLAFNSPDTEKAFHLFRFNLLDMVEIFGFAVATGLISSIPPLISNLSRNPIKDMREE